MSNDARDAPRLYLTTPTRIDPPAFAATLGAVLAACPVACVRLALDPASDEAAWTTAVNHLLPVCHAADVPLVVTDHFRIVAPLGLDGVHLAAARTPIREVRKALGRERIVGALAGASRHRGMTLAEAGADYVAFGPVAATGALGDSDRASDDLFAWWSEMIETPCVAEGGVTPDDARRLGQTADFIVPELAGWGDAGDVIAALRTYAAALSQDR